MKLQSIIEKMATSRNQEGIKDALSCAFGTIIQIKTKDDAGGINIFLVQNKGKGPPGRVRSPGAGCCLRPDNHLVAIEGDKNNYN
jgi:hypothetical protein